MSQILLFSSCHPIFPPYFIQHGGMRLFTRFDCSIVRSSSLSTILVDVRLHNGGKSNIPPPTRGQSSMMTGISHIVTTPVPLLQFRPGNNVHESVAVLTVRPIINPPLGNSCIIEDSLQKFLRPSPWSSEVESLPTLGDQDPARVALAGAILMYQPGGPNNHIKPVCSVDKPSFPTFFGALLEARRPHILPTLGKKWCNSQVSFERRKLMET